MNWWRKMTSHWRIWRQRACSRRELYALDERMLRDLGISRCEALQEADKPFWR